MNLRKVARNQVNRSLVRFFNKETSRGEFFKELEKVVGTLGRMTGRRIKLGINARGLKERLETEKRIVQMLPEKKRRTYIEELLGLALTGLARVEKDGGEKDPV